MEQGKNSIGLPGNCVILHVDALRELATQNALRSGGGDPGTNLLIGLAAGILLGMWIAGFFAGKPEVLES